MMYGRAVLLVVLVLGGLLGGAGRAHAGTSCHAINATGIGQDLGGGQTQATIRGGGLLQGTTHAAFVITDPAYPVAAFGGTVVFTTNRATVPVVGTGTFNLATGQFQFDGVIQDATGKLAGATGAITLQGIEAPDGSFTETVTGQLCVDLSS